MRPPQAVHFGFEGTPSLLDIYIYICFFVKGRIRKWRRAFPWIKAQ